MQISMLSYLMQLLYAILFSFGWGALAICMGAVSTSEKEARLIEIWRNKLCAFFRASGRIKVKSHNMANRIKRIAVDIAFGIISGISITIFAFATGDGILRWFSILALVFGCFFVGKYLHFPLQVLIQCVYTILQCIVQKAIDFFAIPLYKIYRLLAPIITPVLTKMLLLLLNLYGKIKNILFKKTKKKKRVSIAKTEKIRKLYYGRRNFEKD